MTATRSAFGWLSLAMGAAALLMACIHIFGGPFAPQPSVDVTVGELAAKIGKAAVKDLVGLPQDAPAPRPWTLDRYAEIGIAAVAALAVVLACIGFVRKESTRLVAVGAALGLAAIGLKFAMMVVLTLCGLLLIWMVLQFMTDLIPWA